MLRWYRLIWPAVAALAAPVVALGQTPAPPPAPAPAAAPKPRSIAPNMQTELVGKVPKQFKPSAGTWVVKLEAGKRVIAVDGRAAKKGDPAPAALFQLDDSFSSGEVTLKFQLLGGSFRRSAGIIFDVKPNGDFQALAFDGIDETVTHWSRTGEKWHADKRSATAFGLELGTWHELKLKIQGNTLSGWLDGQRVVDNELKTAASGPVGLWSDGDSMAEFSDFLIVPAS
jgi:hypothetical protein